MIAEEREMVIGGSDADDEIWIWSAQRVYITALRKNRAFTEIGSGRVDGTEWAEFTIPKDQWNPVPA